MKFKDSSRIKKNLQKSCIFALLKFIIDINMLEHPPIATEEESRKALDMAFVFSETCPDNQEVFNNTYSEVREINADYPYLSEIQLNKIKRNYIKSNKFDVLLKENATKTS